MNIMEAVADLNAATTSLALTMNATPETWRYIGDVNVHHGGVAIKVDRQSGYASVVECTDLASGIGQEDCVLITTGSVPLGGDLRERKRIRSAMASYGWKASDLLQFPRAERVGEMARALWEYGHRDTDGQHVVCYGVTPDPDDMPHGNPIMEIDSTVEGESALVDKFMEYLN